MELCAKLYGDEADHVDVAAALFLQATSAYHVNRCAWRTVLGAWCMVHACDVDVPSALFLQATSAFHVNRCAWRMVRDACMQAACA